MNRVYNLTLVSIIIVYLVILAGGIVRMTGSGMGCPDWPKCFGYLIPPTEKSQLDWKPNYEYNKDEIIILDENLFYAIDDFNSKKEFNQSKWSKYIKHDYSKFNVYHTWIEYINRLIGAVTGLSVLILFLYSLKFFKTKKIITGLSFLSLLAILFQAWLGKTVVDSNSDCKYNYYSYVNGNSTSIHSIFNISYIKTYQTNYFTKKYFNINFNFYSIITYPNTYRN